MTVAREALSKFVKEKLTEATDAQSARLIAGAPDVPDLHDPERKVGTIHTVHYWVSPELHDQFHALRSAAQTEAGAESERSQS